MWNWVRNIVDKNGSVMTLLIGGAVMLTPFYIDRSERKERQAAESIIVKHNSERVKFYDEYIMESQISRVEAVSAIKQQSEDIKEIKEGIASLVEYNTKQQDMIQKFYHINPDLKNPRFSNAKVYDSNIAYSSK